LKQAKKKRKTAAGIGRSGLQARIDRFADGSVRATGSMLGGKLHGSWKWYRKDGTILRSGSFDRGRQVGRWTTYDARGKAYKITRMKD
jgi:antitoxin component YwqK of YwqJK toxin-antitoxin module